jgi:hypothetical protein
VVVSGGWRVEALHDSGEEVLVDVVADSGERRTIRARYVIGADGGRSSVRELAGIGRYGSHADEKRQRLIVRTSDISARVGAAPSGTNVVVNAKASGFLAAISTREWRVYSEPVPLSHDHSEEELLETARAAFGFDLDLELVSATTYYEATRIATTFRSGRVLLAGDAAHVRTPGGNLGEGFGDVVNLGWKLAAVLAGLAPDVLLDSYDRERRPHNERVAAYALERARRSRDLLADIRAGGVPADDDLSPEAARRRSEIGALLGHTAEDAPGVTFDERYDASDVLWYEPQQLDTEEPWAADRYADDPRPGHRAPDGYVDPWGDTLYDRIGGDLALLVLADAGDVAAAFTASAADRGLPISIVHLTDPAARELYGADHVLVRPDQHVAWRGSALPAGGAAAVLDRLLGLGGPVDPAGLALAGAGVEA